MAIKDFVMDDVVPDAPLHRTAIEHEWSRLMHFLQPNYTHGGAYRNRAGDLVTWDSNDDGSQVLVQTWPGE